MTHKDFIDKDLICYAFYLPSGQARIYPEIVQEEDGSMRVLTREERLEAFSPEGAIYFPETGHQRWTDNKVVLQMRILKNGLEPNISPGNHRDDYIGYYTRNTRVNPYRYCQCFPCVSLKADTTLICNSLRFAFPTGQGSRLVVADSGLFVRCLENKLLGPFAYRMEGDTVILSGMQAKDYEVDVYKSDAIPGVTVDKDGVQVINLITESELQRATPIKRIDCISDDTLRDTLISCLKVFTPETVTSIRGLKDALGEVIGESRMVKVKPDRIKLFTQLLTRFDQYDGLLAAVRDYISKREVFARDLITARPELLKRVMEENPELQAQVLGSDEKIKALRNTVAELEKENAKLRKAKNKPAADPETKEKLAAVQAELRSTLEKQSLLQRNYEEALGECENVRSLSARKQCLQEECEAMAAAEAEQRAQLEALQKQLAMSREELHARDEAAGNRLIEHIRDHIKTLGEKAEEYRNIYDGFAAEFENRLKSYVQGVLGELPAVAAYTPLPAQAPLPAPAEAAEAPAPVPPPALPLAEMPADCSRRDLGMEIIRRVVDYLREAGREVSADDAANYLICLTQGFITAFTGNPGCGKTSLCTLLGRALGLATDAPGTHFVDVPVSRGWSSAKDFIGYYNPFTRSMVKSEPAVYDALELSQSEDCEATAPMVVLLDEANLSPLEHYWAPFLKHADPASSAPRTFSLGGDSVWTIRPHLRFLATINQDHTTEELSPRFLDRAWVIVLREPADDDALPGDCPAPPVKPAVPFPALQQAFAVDALDAPSPEAVDKWDKIRDICRRHRNAIMPRCCKMVTDYTKVASLYMEDVYRPLDCAVAQKVLPCLAGSGATFRSMLEELRRECEGSLPICYSLLSSVISDGDRNMGTYQFFAR